MRDWSSKVRSFTRGAWRELPLEAVAVAVAAISSITVVHQARSFNADMIWQLRLILASVLVTPLFFSMTLLQRQGLFTRKAMLVAGAAIATGVLVALVVALPDHDAIGRSSFVWPYGLALLAAVCCPFVAIAVGRPSNADKDARLGQFTRFVRTFFEQTTTWALLWLGSQLALTVVFTALRELFWLRQIEEMWADVALLVTAALVLSYLYRLLPRPETTSSPARLPEFWRRLVTAIGAPFVSVMLVILVAYEVMVLARGELPVNLLSPLIIAAGFVGFFCTLVIVSILREDVGSRTLAPVSPHRWASSRTIRLVRAFPVVLLVLLPMAGWALALRVDQYGFTPFRVVRLMALACLAVLAILGTARWLRGRMALTWEIPTCVILFALATAFGPASAMNLSIDSQVERLERQLSEAGIARRTVAAQIPPATYRVDDDVLWQLGEQIETVGELGGENTLGRVLSGNLDECVERWQGEHCLRLLGIARRDEDKPIEKTPSADRSYNTGWAQTPISTELGDLEFVKLTASSHYQSQRSTITLLPRAVQIHQEGTKLAEASLDELIAAWHESGIVPSSPLDLRNGDGKSVAQLAIERFDISASPGTQAEFGQISSYSIVAITGVLLWPAPR
ncbi:MAG: DUF4153 domain-containing protein [Proteobacteria bacterium]|nr:DUF4153 domain-containing protein [Pseudomonadota bacterium]